ncbi:MAG TPA: pseudouridine synthase [Candidatus Nanoarchaeia archaeon]|nr:pseudouridine synthase [Candidatus Nanoarchaeia archaeon]
MEEPVFPMRINKYLAYMKHTTRRGADELITQKKVFINGKHAVLGDKVNEGDSVEVRFSGKHKPNVYFVFNKPKGTVTDIAQNHSEQEIKHIVALKNLFPIARLDKESHGLTILTSDDRITENLLNSAPKCEKEYVVTTKTKLRDSFKLHMEKGVQIESDMTAPCKVQILGDNKFKIVLKEEKRNQIRRMCVALHQEAVDIERVRIMNIKLGNLNENGHRKIEGDELADFLHQLDLG